MSLKNSLHQHFFRIIFVMNYRRVKELWPRANKFIHYQHYSLNIIRCFLAWMYFRRNKRCLLCSPNLSKFGRTRGCAFSYIWVQRVTEFLHYKNSLFVRNLPQFLLPFVYSKTIPSWLNCLVIKSFKVLTPFLAMIVLTGTRLTLCHEQIENWTNYM